MKDVEDSSKDVIPLKPLAISRVERGNVVIEVDDDEYRKGV